MGNLVSHLVHARPGVRIIVLDISVDAALLRKFVGDSNGQLQFVEGDVRSLALLKSISRKERITHVVHGATVTHDRELERTDPGRFIDVNLGGTLTILEWMRTLGDLERCIHVSTGGVYGNPTALSPVEFQPETGPFDPPELYAVSKYAAELVARRYGTLFGLPVCRVRLPDVFGPMERPTGARTKASMSLPYRMMRSTIERKPLRISKSTLRAGGDFLSAQDVAMALEILLFRKALPHDVFNIASGKRRNIPEVFDAFRAAAPEFRHQVVSSDQSEIHMNPDDRLARYNAYSIPRISALGWSPRPLETQFRNYRDWVVQEPDVRCPRLD